VRNEYYGSDGERDYYTGHYDPYHGRFVHPCYEQRAYSRSRQFADYLRDASDDWPLCALVPFWFGCVWRWLDHPMASEDEMFAEARQELQRLSEARA
jgi:phenylpropionate dioxygenase-like ring-hydroxylating dioxygenase large terminal subunit